jgi:hypothetical protein
MRTVIISSEGRTSGMKEKTSTSRCGEVLALSGERKEEETFVPKRIAPDGSLDASSERSRCQSG